MDAWRFQSWEGVPGYFDRHDADPLRELISQVPIHGTTAHIGIFCGKHLACCADILIERDILVLAVDTFKGTAGPQMEAADWPKVIYEFGRTVERFNLQVELAVMRSSEASRTYTGPFDLVFIDGDHSEPAMRMDILSWKPLLKHNGILCGHDYGIECFPGVKRAVDGILGKVNTYTGSSIWSWCNG